MKILHNFLILIFITICTNCYSQDSLITPVVIEIKPVTAVATATITATIKIKTGLPLPIFPVSAWHSKNTVGFDLSEIAFINWNAGGVSSISGLFKGNFFRTYTSENSKWVNELIVRYGINKQDGLTVRKADDELRFNSTFGYRKDPLSNWYYTCKINFNTQFSNGYKYPDTSTPISKPFAPAYTFLGAGADYFDKENKFDVYISPLTMKSTLVLDQSLANKGAFGVNKATYDSEGNLISEGKLSKTEIGFLVTNYYKKEVWKNITMENRLSLYSDYINNFGNIDVEWKLQFDLIVNQYVSANIGTHAIYDDDVITYDEIDGVKVAGGPTLQLRQSLGVGMVYVF
ncbi:DUF3078 domain-containing protein [Flavobacterium franklandianum]|uniref:DUF3078 domain-containing protein n=1 Tax=Flavobacterium franklandianum TaxID=2594430 RepID=A0A553CTR5_9FLAO|nr:DUF3078 domain-containing protein [Flavobacterium franklandianum]TRX23910.1 DUF3078 domain-containing protein [Flavobacterium franklandianum]